MFLWDILELFYGRPPVILTVRRGSPFITQLRLQWLEMREKAKQPEKTGKSGEKGPGEALTIQLLGTIDDLVSPDDNVDPISGRDFVYLEVEESGHPDVIEMDGTEAGRKRQQALYQAFNDSYLELQRLEREKFVANIPRDDKSKISCL